MADVKTAKVTAVFGKHIRIFSDGQDYEATVRGKLKKERLYTSPIAVGDEVEFLISAPGQAVIENVLPRRYFLVRPDTEVIGKRQVVAANLDQLVIITSTREPQFKPGLVDRFLVSAEKEKLRTCVVINKIDLAGRGNFRMFANTWDSLGYRTIFTSAKTGEGLDLLVALLEDKVSALAGHSGVGKSALINRIQPDLDLKTRAISKASGKGVHTTTAVVMYHLDINAWVVDTPGLKLFSVVDINKKILQQFFPELWKTGQECRFGNCQHINEPDCAVKQALQTREIAEFRYLSYRKLWQEVG